MTYTQALEAAVSASVTTEVAAVISKTDQRSGLTEYKSVSLEVCVLKQLNTNMNNVKIIVIHVEGVTKLVRPLEYVPVEVAF
jgi:hypothetical protein